MKVSSQKMKFIQFSTPMVQAILDRKKTMTRRVMKPQPEIDKQGMWRWKDCQWMDGGMGFPHSGIEEHAPYKPGDILWVRETWKPNMDGYTGIDFGGYAYRAGSATAKFSDEYNPWRSPRYMPRAAARIFLRVTDARAERLQKITDEDAIAEGCTGEPCRGKGHYMCGDCMGTGWVMPPKAEFMELWDSINGKRDDGRYAWDRNPFCWVYTFERVDVEAQHE